MTARTVPTFFDEVVVGRTDLFQGQEFDRRRVLKSRKDPFQSPTYMDVPRALGSASHQQYLEHRLIAGGDDDIVEYFSIRITSV